MLTTHSAFWANKDMVVQRNRTDDALEVTLRKPNQTIYAENHMYILPRSQDKFGIILEHVRETVKCFNQCLKGRYKSLWDSSTVRNAALYKEMTSLWYPAARMKQGSAWVVVNSLHDLWLPKTILLRLPFRPVSIPPSSPQRDIPSIQEGKEFIQQTQLATGFNNVVSNLKGLWLNTWNRKEFQR